MLSAFLSLSLSLSNSRFVSLSSISSVFFYSWLKGNEFLAPLLSFLSSIVASRRLHLFYSFPFDVCVLSFVLEDFGSDTRIFEDCILIWTRESGA